MDQAGSPDDAAARPKNSAARKLFDAMMREPCVAPFKVLPDPFLYPQYYHVITRPVSFADINMLIGGRARYSLDDFQKDVRRMISNAKRYNTTESDVYQDALSLEVRSVSCGVTSVMFWGVDAKPTPTAGRAESDAQVRQGLGARR